MKKTLICGLLVLGSASAQTGAQVFTLSTPNSALLLQWTEAGGQLTGSAQVVSVQPTSASIGLSVGNAGLSGTRSGSSYAFVLNKSLVGIGVNSMTGTVTGDMLNIQIPSDSGGFVSLKLKRATLENFTVSIDALKAQATKTQQALSLASDLKQTELEVRDAAQDIDAQVKEFAASSVRLTRAVSRVPAVISQLKAVNAAIVSAEKTGSCPAFNIAKDKDDLGRAGLDEAMNVLGDELAANKELSKGIALLMTRFDKGITRLRTLSPSRAADLQQQFGTATAQARQLLASSTVPQATRLQNDSIILIDGLIRENDGAACE